jgi:galactitol-specific phosphotransferase system IIB component
MTIKEKIEAVLRERSFEIHDGALKMDVVESNDYEQIALDIIEILVRDHGLEVEE